MLLLGLWAVVKPQSCPPALSLRHSGRDAALDVPHPGWSHSSTGCSVESCDSWLALTLFLLLLTPLSKAGICCGWGRAVLFGLCPHEGPVSPVALL